MAKRVLVVDDEKLIVKGIRFSLEQDGMEVDCAYDGEEALAYARDNDYDMILLDIMLPGLNGLEILRRLQQKGNTVPVILLTARDAVMDKVAGLDGGAVDYITKPFAIEELLARIRVALKLHGTAAAAARKTDEPGNLTWRKLSLSEQRHQVTWDGEEIGLTNREFRMLKTLLENRDIVLSRETLLEKVCGYDYMGETNVVDVYVRYLRSKIDEVYEVKMIRTVRGVGYVIKEEQDG